MRISCIAFVILLMSVLSFRAEGGRGHKKKHGNGGSKKCTTPGKCSSLKHDIPLPDSPTNVSCPKCDKIFCKPKNPNRLKCKGGFARGVCGCCPVCAKLEGESCGGRNTYLGTCDVGLTCEAEPISSHHMLRTIIEGTQTSLSATASGLNEWKGICKKIDRIQTEPPFRNQQPHRDECRPECTPEFCMANPKDICSATNSAILSQDCQEKCQHTACNACFFQEEPACQKCGKNVFSCIQKFARCTKKKICSKKKYPCKKSKRIQSGKFLCWVPKCL